jgi:hypothetical protein
MLHAHRPLESGPRAAQLTQRAGSHSSHERSGMVSHGAFVQHPTRTRVCIRKSSYSMYRQSISKNATTAAQHCASCNFLSEKGMTSRCAGRGRSRLQEASGIMSMPYAWSAIVSVTIGHQGVHALECERLAPSRSDLASSVLQDCPKARTQMPRRYTGIVSCLWGMEEPR